jgi:hypothetical protein
MNAATMTTEKKPEPGMCVDVLTWISQLLVLKFQSPAMFDAAQSSLALASNI